MVPGTPPPPDTVFSSLGAVDLHSPTVPASGMFQGLRDMREALMLAWGWWGWRGPPREVACVAGPQCVVQDRRGPFRGPWPPVVGAQGWTSLLHLAAALGVSFSRCSAL